MDVCYEFFSLMPSSGSAPYQSKGKLWPMKEITKYKGRIYTSTNHLFNKVNTFGCISTNTWSTAQENKTRQESFCCHAQFPRHTLICYWFVSFWLFSWQIWLCLFLLPWSPSYHTEEVNSIEGCLERGNTTSAHAVLGGFSCKWVYSTQWGLLLQSPQTVMPR